jgi:hypothetical protein
MNIWSYIVVYSGYYAVGDYERYRHVLSRGVSNFAVVILSSTIKTLQTIIQYTPS